MEESPIAYTHTYVQLDVMLYIIYAQSHSFLSSNVQSSLITLIQSSIISDVHIWAVRVTAEIHINQTPILILTIRRYALGMLAAHARIKAARPTLGVRLSRAAAAAARSACVLLAALYTAASERMQASLGSL